MYIILIVSHFYKNNKYNLYFFEQFHVILFMYIKSTIDMANRDVIRIDCQLNRLSSLLRSFKILPVQTCMTDNGAIPKKVPKTNGLKGKSIIGENRFMLQLGKTGVALNTNTHRNMLA